MLHSFLTSGGRPQTTLTNIVTNGNFANGTTGWTALQSTINANDNVLSITGSGVGVSPLSSEFTSTPWANGKKIYLRAEARVTNSVCSQIQANLRHSTGNQLSAVTASPVQNQWYTVSGVGTSGVATENIEIRLVHVYASAATANGKVMEVQGVLAIDLTAIFGAGNEPTSAQMDRWFTVFNISWFNTTRQIPKRIY